MVAALKIVTGCLAPGQELFYPTNGTYLGAARFGSVIGYTGTRYNFVDGDSDWLVWVERKRGEKPMAATDRFYASVAQLLGPDWSLKRDGGSCAMMPLSKLSYARWNAKEQTKIRQLEKDDAGGFALFCG